MIGEITNWKRFREFRAVDLTRSFILSWDVDAETLRIDLDLFLCSDHAFYEKPRPAEQACYRAAVLEFPFCSSIGSDDVVDDMSLSQAAATLSPGRIDDLRLIDDGHYEIIGEFGRAEILAERPILRLKGAST